MNINLHIERLVLDGISVEPHQRAELKAAVETELSQQFIENGISGNIQENSDANLIRGGMILLEGSNHLPNLGLQIGKAVYRGIEK